VEAPRIDLDKATSAVLNELMKGDHLLSLSGQDLDGNGDRCPFVERGSLAVRWDGKVSPCLPLLYTHSHYLGERLRTSHEYFAGDVREMDLLDIWNAPHYRSLRESLDVFDFSPCVSCNSCEMADANRED
jgi:MoaA/NifB/PqqE/SkfB family radical SAM enzyme